MSCLSQKWSLHAGSVGRCASRKGVWSTTGGGCTRFLREEGIQMRGLRIGSEEISDLSIHAKVCGGAVASAQGSSPCVGNCSTRVISRSIGRIATSGTTLIRMFACRSREDMC